MKGSAPRRRDVAEAARRLVASGLNQGATGNVSARRGDGEGMLITPSGVAAEAMRPGDIVSMDWTGSWAVKRAGRRPSSEWRFHRDILQARPEIGAVVHAHALSATALAIHGRGIGPHHYMIAMAGGPDIRCAPYTTFGTEALSEAVVRALEGRLACLMAHHGMIACGADLDAALALAVEVETLAAQVIAAHALGPPPVLAEAEIAAVAEKFAAGPGYGSEPGAEG